MSDRTENILDALLPRSVQQQVHLAELPSKRSSQRSASKQTLSGSSSELTVNRKCGTVAFLAVKVLCARHSDCSQSSEDSEELETDCHQLVQVLHRVISTIDEVVESARKKHRDVIKVEHVNNVYLLCGGLRMKGQAHNVDGDEYDHARAVLDVCLSALQKVMTRTHWSDQGHRVHMKIGVHSGPLVGAVIGANRRFFRIFGDTGKGDVPVFCVNGVRLIVPLMPQLRQVGEDWEVADLSGKVVAAPAATGDVEHLTMESVLDNGTASESVQPSTRMEEDNDNDADLADLAFYRFLNSPHVRLSKVWLRFSKDTTVHHLLRLQEEAVLSPELVGSTAELAHSLPHTDTGLDSLVPASSGQDANDDGMAAPTVHQKLAEAGRRRTMVLQHLKIDHQIRQRRPSSSDSCNAENSGKLNVSISLEEAFARFVWSRNQPRFRSLSALTLSIAALALALVPQVDLKHQTFVTALSVVSIALTVFTAAVGRNNKNASQKLHVRLLHLHDLVFAFAVALSCTTVMTVLHSLAWTPVLLSSAGLGLAVALLDGQSIAALGVCLVAVTATELTLNLVDYDRQHPVCMVDQFVTQHLATRMHFLLVQATALEQHRVDTLLATLMPQFVIGRLRREKGVLSAASASRSLSSMLPSSVPMNPVPQTDRFPSATVFESDLVGFTRLSSELSASRVARMLNTLYLQYDRLLAHTGLEKIDTIGDAFIAVNFLGTPDPVLHFARRVVRLHLKLRNDYSDPSDDDVGALLARVGVRIGIATGPIVGALIGTAATRYHVLGPAFDTAVELESKSQPQQVLVCPRTALRAVGRFRFSSYSHDGEFLECQLRNSMVSKELLGVGKRLKDSGSPALESGKRSTLSSNSSLFSTLSSTLGSTVRSAVEVQTRTNTTVTIPSDSNFDRNSVISPSVTRMYSRQSAVSVALADVSLCRRETVGFWLMNVHPNFRNVAVRKRLKH
ncbi:MAG: hypothetical protein MHM6MM_003396, partial [Cercozoa sp. M6MM]